MMSTIHFYESCEVQLMTARTPRSTETSHAGGGGSGSRGVRRVSLGNDVYEALLSRLISLKISPGSHINVDSLAKELGVSQTPIRAALVRLESEGLVIKTHLVGYSAAPLPNRQRFEQIYELRLVLEPIAAAKAAHGLGAAGLTILRDAHSAMAELASDNARLAYGKFAMRDAEFHAHINNAPGCELIGETLARLHTHMHLFRLLFHSRVTKEAITEHAAILAALEAGDANAAAEAMKRHILFSQRRMAPIFETLD